MTTARRSALVLATLLLLASAALPAGGAASASPQLELGLPNPAFVEALHDPIVSLGLGRLPSPVEVSVGAGVTARAARADLPSAYSLVDLGEGHRSGQGSESYNTLGVRQHRGARIDDPVLAGAGSGPERGQPRRAQRLLQQHGPAVRLRWLRLHGRRLLRPLGRARHRTGGSLRRPPGAGPGGQARPRRRDDPRPLHRPRQRSDQAAGHRQRCPQRRHVRGRDHLLRRGD